MAKMHWSAKAIPNPSIQELMEDAADLIKEAEQAPVLAATTTTEMKLARTLYWTLVHLGGVRGQAYSYPDPHSL